MYFGEIGKRYELTLKLIKELEFASHFGYNQITNIYIFEDADGNQFVWKSSANLGIEREVSRKGCDWVDLQFEGVRKNDTAIIKATVKEHSKYKGKEQTVLTRVKVISIDHAITKEELNERQAAEQMASLQDGDFVWKMPYRQYKEHYADCETIAGSFSEGVNHPTIEVIIRAGRLVPSGVRGKHYHSYVFEIDGEGHCAYYAVSEENAERRCRKDFPEAKSIEFIKMYF